MRHVIWVVMWLTALTGAMGQQPGEVVVVREPGRPEQRCLIEQTINPALYVVRDVATGERLRVADANIARRNGPKIVRVVDRLTSPSDNSMMQALATSPAAMGSKRSPTNAELAGPSHRGTAGPVGGFKPVASLPQRPAISPVQVMLNQLQSDPNPIQRERAAITLTVSDARTVPEVVKALIRSAREDAAASVRTCGVRCLYRIARDVPDVVPVIATLCTDPDPDVAATARLALHEIEKNSHQ